MPKLSEIAQELSMNPEDVQHILVMARSVYSLSTPAGDKGDIDLEGIVEAEGPDSYGTVMAEEMQIEVELLLDTLDERSREVIDLRYGFAGNPRSLAEVAERLNISRERVRQIEQSPKARFQRPPKTHRLHPQKRPLHLRGRAARTGCSRSLNGGSPARLKRRSRQVATRWGLKP